MNYQRLLQELDDVAAWDGDSYTRSHLTALAKQAAAAIRTLQAEVTRSMAAEHATFLLKLGDGLHELGRRMQDHA